MRFRHIGLKDRDNSGNKNSASSKCPNCNKEREGSGKGDKSPDPFHFQTSNDSCKPKCGNQRERTGARKASDEEEAMIGE